MAATIEWETGLLRWGREHREFGDPWETVVAVTRYGTTARLHGGCGPMPRAAVVAIRDALADQGFERIIWERIKDGRVFLKEYKIRGAQ